MCFLILSKRFITASRILKRQDEHEISMSLTTKNLILIIIGWISIGLGVIGVVLPLLPTTPFILLAASCFAKSSPRVHFWLVNHAFFGPIIKNFSHNQAIPRDICIRVMIFICCTLGISMIAINQLWATIMLSILGFIFCAYLWNSSKPT